MPQDQDDIKGADAMKQAPTPGPLSADDVNRECKACGAFKTDRDTACTFCGFAPTAPVEASGSEREDAWRDRALSAEASMDAIRRIEDAKAFGALSATDVACYRYPGEDQQALRGAFVDGVMSQSAWSVWLRGPDEVVAAKSYADAVEYCDRLNAEASLVRAVPMPVGVTLCPQPSGETREAVGRLTNLADDAEAMSLDIAISNYVGTGGPLASDLRALIRPAPVASGGQHSSGEVDRAWLIDIINEHSFASDAADMILERLATPVAETAGEAVDEGVARERIEKIIKANVRSYGRGGALTFTGVENAAKVILAAYPSPTVPAQDDDKLRIAVEALEGAREDLIAFATARGSEYEGTREDATHDVDQALAVLKSTAAQEGGK